MICEIEEDNYSKLADSVCNRRYKNFLFFQKTQTEEVTNYLSKKMRFFVDGFGFCQEVIPVFNRFNEYSMFMSPEIKNSGSESYGNTKFKLINA